MTSSPLTCVTCRVVFSETGRHKAHFQSDWHRFNIHRHLEDMAPVTEDVFLQRIVPVVQARQDAKAKKPSFNCELCKKQFFSQAALANHLKSRKHSAEAEDGGAGMLAEDDELMQEKIQEQLEKLHIVDPKEECLFCSARFQSIDQVVDHMTKAHSLFIPDLEYLVDLPGLLHYFAEKLSMEFKCLYCSSHHTPSHFHSLAAVRKHMIDRSHCKIRFDEAGCHEISPFYNWESLYPEGNPEFKDAIEDSDGWEDMSESDDVARAGRPLLVSPDGAEMLLPNGALIGNRELRRYYKQHLRPVEDIERDRLRLQLLHEYRQQGHSTALVPAERVLLERSQRNANHVNVDSDLRLAVKANKFQPHKRLQIR